MPAKKPGLIVRASVVIGGFMILAPLVSVLIWKLLADWRTYVALAVLSVVAYLIVHERGSGDRLRSGSIERTPYELTSASNRRRQ